MDFFQYEFFRNACMAAFLASIACGIVGAYVVVKRIVSISGGISHTAFGGIGLGYLLGISPLLMLIPFSILSALGMGWMSKRAHVAEDTMIGIFWAFGMAVGILCIGCVRGYVPDLFSYLFGNILTIPFSDLVLMALLDGVIVLVVGFFYKELLAFCFDEEFAKVSGLNIKLWYSVLLVLVALTVVVLIRMVGVILVITLLTIPAAIARHYTHSLLKIMISAIGIGMLLTFAGLLISFAWNIPSGATIILVAVTVFGISTLLRRTLRRFI